MRPKATRPLCASQGLRGPEDMQTCGTAPSDDLRPATATQQAASRELVTGRRRHIAFRRGTSRIPTTVRRTRAWAAAVSLSPVT